MAKQTVVAFFALLLVAILGGCDDFPGTAEHAAHEAVKRQLIDGDSAKFRDEEASTSGAVCGFVNAKNRMGAYVGFTPYVHTPDISSSSPGLTFISPGEPDFAEYFRYKDNEFMVSDEIKKVSDACLFVTSWNIWCSEHQKAAFREVAANCKLWDDNKFDELKSKLGIY